MVEKEKLINFKQERESSEEPEIIDDSSYNKGDNIKGVDDISRLELLFKNDILYKMLERADLEKEIITSEMYQNLRIGRNYRPQDASEFTGVNEGTLRGWLNGKDNIELPLYIGSTKESKFHILDAEAVYRIRLIYLVQQNLKYSLSHISSICTGKAISGKVIVENETNKLQDQVQELQENYQKLEQQNKMLYNMISTLVEKDNFSGQWKLKEQALPQLLENNPEIDKMKNTIDQLNNQVKGLEEKLQQEKESKVDVKLEVSKANMLYRQAEHEALENRSLLEKLLNKKPSIETIESYLYQIKKKAGE